MKLSDLHPTPHNPREILSDALTGLTYSMQKFGDLSGIVLNVAEWTQGGLLVCGHKRVKALSVAYNDLELQDGVIVTPTGKRFPVRIVNWPRQKHDAAMVAANNEEIQGHWTPAVLPVLESLKDFDGFGELRLPELENMLIAIGAQADYPILKDGSKEPFAEMTFILHDSQAEIVEQAIKKAKTTEDDSEQPNENSNGNALFWLARRYLDRS